MSMRYIYGLQRALYLSGLIVLLTMTPAYASTEHGHDEKVAVESKHESQDEHGPNVKSHEHKYDNHAGEDQNDEHKSDNHADEGHKDDHDSLKTSISEQSAKESGIIVDIVGAQVIKSALNLTGKIILNKDKTVKLKARFDGIVKEVKVDWGQHVNRGDPLAVIEASESLLQYEIMSPISGIILQKNTNIGDVTDKNTLFLVADMSTVWAEFHIFPKDIEKVQVGQKVHVHTLGNGSQANGKISMLLPTADAYSQTIIGIVPIKNEEQKWRPGTVVEGDVLIDQKQAPLTIRKSAIQNIEGKTIVFIKKDNMYFAKEVVLGISDKDYAEVTQGLKVGDEYVVEGSFIVKSDILKSTVEHSH